MDSIEMARRCVARLRTIDEIIETSKHELKPDAYKVAHAMHVGEKIGIVNTLRVFGFVAECDEHGQWTVR